MRLVTASLATLLLTGCGGVAAAPRSATPLTSTTPIPVPESSPVAPAADVRIPTDPAKLAAALKQTTPRLHAALDAWDKSSEPSKQLQLLALHQQRAYRTMARSSKLATATIARLPQALRAEARDSVTAVSKLLSMAHPITAAQRGKLKFVDPLPAKRLRGHMVAAEKRFGVDWQVLAAIILVETKFGRITSSSSTGAQGPMQFMPGTWKAYGMGGDVHDARDAIMAAANYLKATGAPRDYRKAIWHYNHDTRYVDAVLAHAAAIERDPEVYYAYYNWQVFVLSSKGDVRMTGPGK
ncbi:lytic murein transglycosylase [Nonomuraea soli]|uniref:Soluble lytic murein transglycosylase-like protein n=1 Tax=Nonomuraea soli TaxID=1032476 RepID=A0A7W0HPL3_9ACTN|nr:lytic murein transglycosylase [Nonomuraea soli]MBA2890979.1 soluble lytic murein transglycosylase-like protein [Nonomuraea soli]